jgi:hypothetical protein
MKIELIENCLSQFVTQDVYNGLCQFVYSDSKERIKLGDRIRWVYKLLDVPIELPNGGYCDKELMLINADTHNCA